MHQDRRRTLGYGLLDERFSQADLDLDRLAPVLEQRLITQAATYCLELLAPLRASSSRNSGSVSHISRNVCFTGLNVRLRSP